MPARPNNVAVVDDHTLFRKTLRNFLSDQGGLNVVIQSGDIEDLLARMKNNQPDVVIMDIFMPHLDGIDGVKIIRNGHPEVRVLVLSMNTDLSLISNLLDLGIH